MSIRGLTVLYIVIAMSFTHFEGLMGCRSTRRPCHLSEKAYKCSVQDFLFVKSKWRLSAPSVYRGSTNSLIIATCTYAKKQYEFSV